MSKVYFGPIFISNLCLEVWNSKLCVQKYISGAIEGVLANGHVIYSMNENEQKPAAVLSH